MVITNGELIGRSHPGRIPARTSSGAPRQARDRTAGDRRASGRPLVVLRVHHKRSFILPVRFCDLWTWQKVWQPLKSLRNRHSDNRIQSGLNKRWGEDVAVKISVVHWALTQQTTSGWYQTNAFTADKTPFTHTIAYAIRGFLESGILLNQERYIESALRAARGMANVQRSDGWLAGTYGDNWKETAGYCCLTGVAQMSLNWMRLSQDCNAPELKASAQKAIRYLKSQQSLNNKDEAVRGAIAGSTPIWGDYSRFEFPNWAAKFFADAVLMDITNQAVPPVVARIESPAPLSGFLAGWFAGLDRRQHRSLAAVVENELQ